MDRADLSTEERSQLEPEAIARQRDARDAFGVNYREPGLPPRHAVGCS